MQPTGGTGARLRCGRNGTASGGSCRPGGESLAAARTLCYAPWRHVCHLLPQGSRTAARRDDLLPCRAYLRFCALAAQKLGPEVHANFLDSTFLVCAWAARGLMPLCGHAAQAWRCRQTGGPACEPTWRSTQTSWSSAPRPGWGYWMSPEGRLGCWRSSHDVAAAMHALVHACRTALLLVCYLGLHQVKAPCSPACLLIQ